MCNSLSLKHSRRYGSQSGETLSKKRTKQSSRLVKRSGTIDRSYTQTAIARSSSWRVVVIFLFKPDNRWHEQHKERAAILFAEYPKLKRAYNLSMLFRSCYQYSKTKEIAKQKLTAWYEKIEASGMDEFLVPVETIRLREHTILNYLVNRSTNAAAESFNAKLKNFRAVVRGVAGKKFYLFRVAKLYG